MISYCITNLGRRHMLGELIRSINAQANRDFEIVVANYDEEEFEFLNCRVVKCTGRFSRSIGLNKAADQARGSILAFLDADMFIPPDFSNYLAKLVTPGTCCFPICFSLHKDKPRIVGGRMGWWRREGSGNCAFASTDFRKLRWNEARHTRGGEDTELLRRAGASLRVIREPVNGFFHRWHPMARSIGGITIYANSKCNAGCPLCSQLHTRLEYPDYSCSMEELERFLSVMRESLYVSDAAIVSGGEPSIWEHLAPAVLMLRNSDIFRKLLIFTNGSDADRLLGVYDMVDLIRVSKYSWNTKQVETLLKRGRKVEVVDRTAHIDISSRKINRSVGPVECNCKSISLFNGFIHTCDNAKNLEAIFKTGTPHKIQVQPFFLDKMPPRLNALCGACWSNLAIKERNFKPSTKGNCT